MRRRFPLRVLLPSACAGLLGFGCGFADRAEPLPQAPVLVEGPAMGTLFRARIHGADRARARAAGEAALARVRALEAVLTDYDPGSEAGELGRASDAGPVASAIRLGPDLARALAVAAEVHAASDGAFDVTVGPLVRLWRRARRQEELPDPERLAAARAAVGFELLGFDAEGARASPRAAGMRLDFGGVGKGLALDLALEVLAERGFPAALVEAGGDLVVGEPPPGRAAWRVEVRALAAGDAPLVLGLARAGVATSGDTARYVVLVGVRYSHIVDPRDGRALTRRCAACVVAPDGARADAWASAACVLGADEAPARIAALGAGYAARVEELAPAAAPGARVRVEETPGFAALRVR